MQAIGRKNLQVIHLNTNLRALRESKGLSQSAFAELFGLTRAKVDSYEKDSEPRIETILRIADYFSIPLNDLLAADIADDLRSLKYNSAAPIKAPPDAQVNAQVSAQPTGQPQNETYIFSAQPETQLPAAADPLAAYITGAQQRPPLVVAVDSDNQERIVLVREEAQAGYLVGFADTEFVATLPSFNLPGLTGRTFRAFQVRGDSMLSALFPGDVVVCSYVDNWRYIRSGDVYVIVSPHEGIVVKRVTSKLDSKERPHLICRSDNTAYKTFTLPVGDVSEVWRFEARISFQLASYTDNDVEGRLTTLEIQMADLLASLEKPAKRRLSSN